VAINDIGFRPHVGVEEPGGRLRGVEGGDEVDVMANEEGGVSLGVRVNADGENGDAGHVVVKLEERGQFLEAGLAPGGPEIDQDDLSAIIREVDGAGSVAYGEVGCGDVELCGMCAAVASREQGDGKG